MTPSVFADPSEYPGPPAQGADVVERRKYCRPDEFRTVWNAVSAASSGPSTLKVITHVFPGLRHNKNSVFPLRYYKIILCQVRCMEIRRALCRESIRQRNSLACKESRPHRTPATLTRPRPDGRGWSESNRTRHEVVAEHPHTGRPRLTTLSQYWSISRPGWGDQA